MHCSEVKSFIQICLFLCCSFSINPTAAMIIAQKHGPQSCFLHEGSVMIPTGGCFKPTRHSSEAEGAMAQSKVWSRNLLEDWLYCSLMGWWTPCFVPCGFFSACVLMRVYMHVYNNVRACMSVCNYICMHVCMHACMHVCLYMCVCVSFTFIYIYIYMYLHL